MKLPGRLVRGPIRPDRWTALRFASLRWAALPVIDRRWTAPMAAIALGFGLFVGVAIGPGTSGSLGTTKPILVRVATPSPDQTTALKPPDDAPGDKPSLPPASPANNPPPVSPNPTPSPEPTPSVPPISTSPPISSPISPVAPAPVDSTETTPTDTTNPDGTTEPVEPSTVELAGAVVHTNPKAASYTISSDDELIAIHTFKRIPEVGQNIEVEALQLANGTYGEDGNRRERGRKAELSFGGLVSFHDPATNAYTVSAPGVSLLVRGKQGQLPGVGEAVSVDARIADHPEELPVSPPGKEGCGEPPNPPKPPSVALEQTGLVAGSDAESDEGTDGKADDTTDGDGTTSSASDGSTVPVEAIIQGVCRQARQLIVSADDVRESGRDIAVGVPKRFRIASLKPGQVVKLEAKVGKGGAYTLTAVAGDERRQGADNEKLIQP